MDISSIGANPYIGNTATSGVAQSGSTEKTRPHAHATKAQRDQFRGDLANLFSAVKSGDMTAAQKALEAVNTDRSALYTPSQRTQSSQQSTASTASSSDSRQTDFQTLVDAVNKGDVQGAQDALKQLQADRGKVQGAGQRGHHHHHHASAAAGANSTNPSTSATAIPVATSTDTDGDGDGR